MFGRVTDKAAVALVASVLAQVFPKGSWVAQECFFAAFGPHLGHQHGCLHINPHQKAVPALRGERAQVDQDPTSNHGSIPGIIQRATESGLEPGRLKV